MLELLGKILKEIRKTERAYENAQSLLTTREKSDLEIITKMYRQQKNHFQSKDCRESIPNRIVSISKPYVRPIVRGKEVKSVEFGAKVNNILVDGISFIERRYEKLCIIPFMTSISLCKVGAKAILIFKMLTILLLVSTLHNDINDSDPLATHEDFCRAPRRVQT